MPGCGATCGIQNVRTRERVEALDVIARAHRHELIASPPSPARLAKIAARCAEVLPVRALVRPAGSGDRQSSWIYLLAGLHEPSLVELVDHPSSHLHPVPQVLEETYVRLGFSSLGRYVTLQEVRFEAELLDDGTFITETPLAGVDDRRLAMIIKGLQGVLRAEKLIVLDMAFLLGETQATEAETQALATAEHATHATSGGHSNADATLDPNSPWFTLFEPLPCHTPSMIFVPSPSTSPPRFE